MEYHLKDLEDAQELAFVGHLLFKDRDPFICLLDQFIASRKKTLSLNLQDISYMDSAAIGFLFLARQMLDSMQKELILKSPSPFVYGALSTMHMQKMFNIVQDTTS